MDSAVCKFLTVLFNEPISNFIISISKVILVFVTKFYLSHISTFQWKLDIINRVIFIILIKFIRIFTHITFNS